MNELELREKLSNRTTDMLVEIIIRLLRHIILLEMTMSENKENEKM